MAATAALAIAAAIDVPKGGESAPPRANSRGLRQPVNLILADNDRWLFTANQRSGSVSVVDLTSLRVVREVPVGRRLADLALLPDGSRLLAVDEEANELITIRRHGPSLEVVDRLPVPMAPVSVQVAPDGKRCYVASLWSHRLTIVDLPTAGADQALITRSLPLPFAPRKLLLLASRGIVLVTDAFGGKLALVDARTDAIRSLHELPAHNIQGLAVDGDRLFLTHQHLNSRAITDFDDVHWGNLITNNLRELSLASLTRSQGDPLAGGFVHYLGDVQHGAGDPAGVARAPDGTLVVTLSGVNQAAISTDQGRAWTRLVVGRRPMAVVLSHGGLRAFVANRLDDTISVIDVAAQQARSTIALGPVPELAAADRGERLFYSSRLAHDGWFSCHSCHTEGHTNGQLNDNLSDGSFGTPKRILTLRGVRDTAPYAWLGTMPDLEAQIQKSIQITMQGAKPSEQDVRDLAAFLRTLSAPPAATEESPTLVAAGKAIFLAQACGNCHTPPNFTSKRTYEVGLADEAGNSHFNPPSLRGLSQGGPYFHDGRATTLAEVFSRFHHQLKTDISNGELQALLAYLRSL
jgi:YVTN family beta-propeller protein